MSFGEMGVGFFEQYFFGGAPEVGVMAEGAVVALPYFDDFVVGEGLAALEATDGLHYANGIIERAEGVDLGVEPQSAADVADFVGEAGAQEEEAVAVGERLGERGDIDWGGEVQGFFVIRI